MVETAHWRRPKAKHGLQTRPRWIARGVERTVAPKTTRKQARPGGRTAVPHTWRVSLEIEADLGEKKSKRQNNELIRDGGAGWSCGVKAVHPVGTESNGPGSCWWGEGRRPRRGIKSEKQGKSRCLLVGRQTIGQIGFFFSQELCFWCPSCHSVCCIHPKQSRSAGNAQIQIETRCIGSLSPLSRPKACTGMAGMDVAARRQAMNDMAIGAGERKWMCFFFFFFFFSRV